MLEEIKQSIVKNIWKNKIPNPIYDTSTTAAEIPNSDEYFPKEVVEYIRDHPHNKLLYSATNPIKYHAEFYCYEDSIPLETIQHQMKLVVWWLSTIQQYTIKKCDHLKLTVYLTPLKKTIPANIGIGGAGGGGGSRNATKNHVILSPINCNTGLSAKCGDGGFITIYREEEWFKVFIHETFHYFGLDFAFEQPPSVTTALRRLFCVSSDIWLFESYTEFWAEIIVMLVYSNIHSVNLSTIVADEITHGLGQAKKVLICQDFTYSQLLSPCKKDRLYIEHTNVFAYYIIKMIFLYFHEEFIQWCIDNNPNLLQITPSELPRLIDWIEQHYRSPDFVEAMDNAVVAGNGLRMTTINI
jgi:hypothetical protein